MKNELPRQLTKAEYVKATKYAERAINQAMEFKNHVKTARLGAAKFKIRDVVSYQGLFYWVFDINLVNGDIVYNLSKGQGKHRTFPSQFIPGFVGINEDEIAKVKVGRNQIQSSHKHLNATNADDDGDYEDVA